MRLPSIIICLILLAGCANSAAPMDSRDTEDDVNLTKISTEKNYSQDPSNHAKDILREKEEITSVRAVNTDKTIVIGIEIEHHERFKLAANREKYKKAMEKEFKEMDVELSTDMKINLELDELEKKVQNGSISDKKLKKELKRVADLSKEQT